MNKPEDFKFKGPSYKDQVYTEYLNLNIEKNEKYVEIWDKAIKISERAHEERIRNILSPLFNLVGFLTNKDSNENLKNIEEMILSKDSLKLYLNCLDRLLNIPEQ